MSATLKHRIVVLAAIIAATALLFAASAFTESPKAEAHIAYYCGHGAVSHGGSPYEIHRTIYRYHVKGTRDHVVRFVRSRWTGTQYVVVERVNYFRLPCSHRH